MVEGAERPVAWVVPGPLRQVTGGYLYDSRIVDGLRVRRWTIGIVDVQSTRWPLDPTAGRRLLTALARERWSAVVVDEWPTRPWWQHSLAPVYDAPSEALR